MKLLLWKTGREYEILGRGAPEPMDRALFPLCFSLWGPMGFLKKNRLATKKSTHDDLSLTYADIGMRVHKPARVPAAQDKWGVRSDRISMGIDKRV